MKALLLLAAAVTFSLNVHAQGTVNFANGGAGVNAPIRIFGGPLASTANGPWLAMLYAGPAGTSQDLLSSTIVSGSPAAAGVTPGYVFGGLRTISGIPSGSPAVLQIRVWRADFGATWEEAGGFSGLYNHWSVPLVTIPLGGGPTPTPNMVGLAGFVTAPEPSSIAIAVLGCAALFLLRRSKKG